MGERRADGGSIPEELRVRFLGPFVFANESILVEESRFKILEITESAQLWWEQPQRKQKRLEETGDLPPHSHLVGHYELELRL